MTIVDRLQGLYSHSPVFLQNLMVTGYGYVLHRRRYGKEHDRTLAFLMETYRWDKGKLKELELRRLKETLAYARQHVPYYRELWEEIGFDPRDVNRLEDIRQLPITEKEDVRENPGRFVSDLYDHRKIFKGNTSGTTGMPLMIYKDKSCYQMTWAFQERQRRIWGINGERPRVSIGVRQVVPLGQDGPPFWRHDHTEDNWFFSNFHISEQSLDEYVDKIAEIDPEEINAYPSGVYLVAARTLRRAVTSIRPRTVITCAETLYSEQRRTIEDAFGCKVADQYGAAEVPFWVGQCPYGTYHINHEFGHVETVKGDQPVRDEPGDVIGTGFINRVQVLIRYRLGDVLVLPSAETDCPCGWKTETVDQIIGRIDDILYTPDGRSLGRLDIILKKVAGVLEAQLVQDARDHLLVNLVPVSRVPPDAEGIIHRRITEMFGPGMRVDFQWVDHIPRTARGKFRYQLNLMDRSEE